MLFDPQIGDEATQRVGRDTAKEWQLEDLAQVDARGRHTGGSNDGCDIL